MERSIKYKPNNLCIAIFTLCLSIRFVEYFLIETDKTAIGENVLHKVAGIIILALTLKRIELSWSDIGFQRNGFVSSILKGLLLGSICFSISFGLELAILALQGNPAHLEIYISSFSLTGSQIKNTDFVFFLLCVLFNVVNVWMEEGVFRGLFIKILSDTKPFMQANFIAAFLFGIWHIVMPIRSYVNGEMSFAAMVLMGIGYIILAGIMGVKWGLLYQITRNIWVGLGEHLFNNTVATNMLHVVSLKGADELQIIRIMVAQIISFTFVLVIYYYGNKRGNRLNRNLEEEVIMSRLEVNIEYIEQQTIYGLWKKSNDRTISKDINALSKQYYAVVSMPEGNVLPYFVLSRNYNKQSHDFELFIGSVIDKSGLESCVLSANEYAKITIKPKLGFLWGASIGEAKRYFYGKWLLENPYEALNMEYEYHTEKSIGKHPVIDIIFAIKKTL